MANQEKLMQKLKNDFTKNNLEDKLTFNEYLRYAFYSDFLSQLHKHTTNSRYILKGGYLILNWLDFERHATIDIDMLVKKSALNLSQIEKEMKETIFKFDSIISYSFDKAELIKKTDNYKGLRITINYQLEKLNDKIKIDIATNDIVTPTTSSIKLNNLISDEKYDFECYNVETFMAEKIQSILVLSNMNSRMKDFQDIYLIYNDKKYDKITLNDAIITTCKNRETLNQLYNYEFILDQVLNDQSMNKMWSTFDKKNINFNQIIDILLKIIRELEFNEQEWE